MADGTKTNPQGNNNLAGQRIVAKPSPDADLKAQLEAMQAENERLKAKLATSKPMQGVSCKVSDKGCLSVYGLGRFPVTLYVGQWERLFAHKDQIEAFAKAHEAQLARKA